MDPKKYFNISETFPEVHVKTILERCHCIPLSLKDYSRKAETINVSMMRRSVGTIILCVRAPSVAPDSWTVWPPSHSLPPRPASHLVRESSSLTWTSTSRTTGTSTSASTTRSGSTTTTPTDIKNLSSFPRPSKVNKKDFFKIKNSAFQFLRISIQEETPRGEDLLRHSDLRQDHQGRKGQVRGRVVHYRGDSRPSDGFLHHIRSGDYLLFPQDVCWSLISKSVEGLLIRQQ